MNLKNWKLKLRYGKLLTPYKHYVALAQVRINAYIDHLDAQPGTAWVGIKIWATDTDEVIDMVSDISEQMGLSLIGKIEIYQTEPIEPFRDKPYAYGINLTYYDE